MDAPSYFFQMHHGTGVATRALLNDLPFYRGDGQRNITVSGPGNHLLLPGENVLTLEVSAAPHPEDAPASEGPVRFTLRVDDDDAEIVHRIGWPECGEALPAAARALPAVHASRFLIDERLTRPIYWDAPPARFDREGTPEQREAVREVLQAFVDRDADAFLAANALKLEERLRAYPDTADSARGSQRQKIAGFFERGWKLRPVDMIAMKDLAFESRAEGRVAYVTRRDGGHTVEAVATDDPSEIYSTDLFLTRHDGRWRVFR